MRLKHVKQFDNVQRTSLMKMTSSRPTHKEGCEGITGGRTDCEKPMSPYLGFIRYIAVDPSWKVANERNQFIRRRNFSTRSTLKEAHHCALGWRWEIIIIIIIIIICNLGFEDCHVLLMNQRDCMCWKVSVILLTDLYKYRYRPSHCLFCSKIHKYDTQCSGQYSKPRDNK
jgi:hypothetical protein